MTELWSSIQWIFGLDMPTKDLNLFQVSMRAVAIYVAGLFILRLSDNRFLGKHTVFDIILGFMLGAILSRAVNGSAPLFSTIGAAAVLVALHYLLGWLSFHTHSFGTVVKGNPKVLVRDGQILWDDMRRKVLSERDLEEALRLNGKTDRLEDVREARFERNGEISVILQPRDSKPKEPKVVEIEVREGVQTVRIEIS